MRVICCLIYRCSLACGCGNLLQHVQHPCGCLRAGLVEDGDDVTRFASLRAVSEAPVGHVDTLTAYNAEHDEQLVSG